MKTLKTSFEDSALEAFEAYAQSLKMSPSEVLGQLTQELVNSSSSHQMPVMGRKGQNVSEAYYAESIRLLSFLKVSMVRLLSDQATKNSQDIASAVEELEGMADALARRTLTSIRNGVKPSSLSLAADMGIDEEMAEEAAFSKKDESVLVENDVFEEEPNV